MAKTAENILVVDITNNIIIQNATVVKQLHTDLGELETTLTNKKADLVNSIVEMWEAGILEGFYPKNYKADTSLGIVQIEAKVATAKGTMDISMEPVLQATFGDFTDSLFQKDTVLDEVVDKRKVLEALLKPGINLNDIEISFKNPELLKEIEKTKALTTKEVIIPKAKFLDLLNDVPVDIRKKAADFLKKFLDNAQSFVVVCGNRGKK